MYLSTFRPEYLSSLEYYWYLAQCEIIILTDHFQYTKRSPISISAPLKNVDDRLRIPVRHDHKPKSVSEKRIDNKSNWKKKHFNSIYHTFHNYPFAYYYLPIIEDIYKETNNKLSDFLFNFIQLLTQQLHLSSKIYRSSELKHDMENTELIIHWSKKTLTNTYLSFAEVYDKGWINKDRLLKAKIICKPFLLFPEAHIFKSNKSNSILNFLLQYGPEAGCLIKQYMPGRYK